MNAAPQTYARAILEVYRTRKFDRMAAKRFFEIIRRSNRVAWIPEIVERFAVLRDRAEGKTRVRFTAARKEMKKMIPEVKRKFGRKTEVDFIVDPTLIGGIELFVNNERIIDASVRGQLARIFSK